MIVIIGIFAFAVGYLQQNYDKNTDYGFGSSDDTVDEAVDIATNMFVLLARCWQDLY